MSKIIDFVQRFTSPTIISPEAEAAMKRAFPNLTIEAFKNFLKAQQGNLKITIITRDMFVPKYDSEATYGLHIQGKMLSEESRQRYWPWMRPSSDKDIQKKSLQFRGDLAKETPARETAMIISQRIFGLDEPDYFVIPILRHDESGQTAPIGKIDEKTLFGNINLIMQMIRSKYR